jgi:hypothetical protein
LIWQIPANTQLANGLRLLLPQLKREVKLLVFSRIKVVGFICQEVNLTVQSWALNHCFNMSKIVTKCLVDGMKRHFKLKEEWEIKNVVSNVLLLKKNSPDG